LPSADAWATMIAADYRKLPGYVEMVLDPHKTVIPTAMIAAATAWLSALPAGPPAPPSPVSAVCSSERPVVIADLLFAILDTPTARPTGRAILLLNAGAVSHVGPNRLYVALARRWAALGHVVLRVDNSGVGDSATRPGAPDNVIYSPRGFEDVA